MGAPTCKVVDVEPARAQRERVTENSDEPS